MSLSSKYGYTPDNEAIAHNLELIAASLEGLASPELYKACFGIMDQTTLANDDTPASVKAMVEKVNALRTAFPDFPYPASCCVYPNFASVVAATRASKDIHVTAWPPASPLPRASWR